MGPGDTMRYAEPLDYIPLWGIYTATVVIVLLSIEGGFRLGRRRVRITEAEKESSVGSMVAHHWVCWHSCWHSRSGWPSPAMRREERFARLALVPGGGSG